jgi:flagellar biosynthesis protein FliR
MSFEGLTNALPLFVLASLRVALTLAGMPAPFGAVAPMRIRTALSVVLSLALCAPLLETAAPISLAPASLLSAAVCELFLGAIMGLTVRITLAACEVAGTMAGQAMGLGFATSVDPTFGEGILPTAYLLGALGTLIFFGLNGHHIVIAALAQSLTHVPIGHGLPIAGRAGVLGLGGQLVARGLQIAAPVVATMFIVQLGVSFVSRTAQRVHLFSFQFAVAIAAGMLVLWISAPAICTAIAVQVRHLPDAFLSIIGN